MRCDQHRNAPCSLHRLKLDQRRRRRALKAEFARVPVHPLALGAGPEGHFLPRQRRRLRLGLLALVAQHASAKIHLPTGAGPVVRVLAWQVAAAHPGRQRRRRGTALETLSLGAVVDLAALAQPVAGGRLTDSGTAGTSTDASGEARRRGRAEKPRGRLRGGGGNGRRRSAANSLQRCTLRSASKEVAGASAGAQHLQSDVLLHTVNRNHVAYLLELALRWLPWNTAQIRSHCQ